MRYQNLIDEIARRLASAGLHFGHGADNAHDEAWFLVAAAAGIPVMDLPVADPASEATVENARNLVAARIATRKPLPYLTGETWFYGLPLYCSDNVLSPRSPIGELLHGRLLSWLARAPRRIADIGTGSGSLAITAALCFPQARVTALDLSDDALRLTEKNVARHGLNERVRIIRSDGLAGLAGGKFDLLLSNPPYVPWQEYLTLPPEYRHEPRLALISPDDGLAFTRQLLREAGRHLADDGLLVVEVGNTEQALMQRWPDFPADWPVFEQGGGGVFIISARELAHWRRSHPAL